MRYKIIFLCLFLLLSSFISRSEAQNVNDSWKAIVHFQGGIFGNGGAYVYKVSEESFFYGKIEGSIELKYKTGALFYGGFEISKGYIGFQGNFGVTPAKLKGNLNICVFDTTLIEEQEEASINTFYAEGAFLFFPTGSGVDKISPYLTAGFGSCRLSGDRDDSGYLISYGGGVRIFLARKYGLVAGFKGFILDFGKIEGVFEEKLKLKPLQGSFGFIYRF